MVPHVRGEGIRRQVEPSGAVVDDAERIGRRIVAIDGTELLDLVGKPKLGLTTTVEVRARAELGSRRPTSLHLEGGTARFRWMRVLDVESVEGALLVEAH